MVFIVHVHLSRPLLRQNWWIIDWSTTKKRERERERDIPSDDYCLVHSATRRSLLFNPLGRKIKTLSISFSLSLSLFLSDRCTDCTAGVVDHSDKNRNFQYFSFLSFFRLVLTHNVRLSCFTREIVKIVRKTQIIFIVQVILIIKMYVKFKWTLRKIACNSRIASFWWPIMLWLMTPKIQ